MLLVARKASDGNLLYPARSQWGTCRGCCSRRDGARTSG